MAKRVRPWQAEWQEVGPLSPGGGQGRIVLVTRADEAEGGEPFALKILKNQKDSERRRRMHREVAALQSLDHPGIPKCLDSNAHQFADLSVDLYLVTEFIPGQTLEQFIGDQPVEPELAIVCMLRIIDILEYCHSRNIVHRDLKPENIVLRSSALADPVLLDFGLSFNADDEPDHVTWQGEELGNRFLRLPELQHPGPTQRDRRADVAQCVGILFYLITGQRPRTLNDHFGRKPHERDEALRLLNRLDGPLKDRLYEVFDKGFEPIIDRRIQTADELRLLITSSSGQEVDKASGEKIARIKAALGLDEQAQRLKGYTYLLQESARVIDETCREFGATLFGEDHEVNSEHKMDGPNLRLEVSQDLHHRSHSDKAFRPRFLATITESQLRIIAQEENGRTAPIFITPVGGPINWLWLKERLQQLYLERVSEIVSGRIRPRLMYPLPEPMVAPLSKAALCVQLRQLPLRAIVAFAARCARRVLPVFAAATELSDHERHLANLESAIGCADAYARGDPTAAAGEHAQNALATATAVMSSQLGFAAPTGILSTVAHAAQSAAFTALFARQNDLHGAASCGADAYDYANRASPAAFPYALRDLRQLLVAEVGQAPHLGLPVDPGESGLLGPLRPGRGI